MEFGDFKYPEVVQQFGLTWQTEMDLFASVPPLNVPLVLRDALALGGQLAGTVNTEKARSEWMIAPLLMDFWSRYRG